MKSVAAAIKHLEYHGIMPSHWQAARLCALNNAGYFGISRHAKSITVNRSQRKCAAAHWIQLAAANDHIMLQ